MDNITPNDNNFNFFKLKYYKILFYALSATFFIFFFSFFSLLPPKNFPIGSVININEGANLRSISLDLKNHKIIRSRVVFETLVIFLNGDKKISTGDYLFEEKVSVFEVAKRIAMGDRHLAPIKITIPEGFNIEEIAKVCSKKLKNFNKGRFLLNVSSKEGYLFPDTYFFFSEDNEEDVLKAMNSNFNNKISSVRNEINSSGKNLEDIIIMASILEKESKGDEDRELISGILWRRIDMGMPLQVDADMITYKVKGLPEHPISNPGMEAIKASIHPKKSEYLYYLHDKEGNVHFARTFSEHKINKNKYLK